MPNKIFLGPLRDMWKAVADWVTGASHDEPKVDVTDRSDRKLGEVTLTGTTVVDAKIHDSSGEPIDEENRLPVDATISGAIELIPHVTTNTILAPGMRWRSTLSDVSHWDLLKLTVRLVETSDVSVIVRERMGATSMLDHTVFEGLVRFDGFEQQLYSGPNYLIDIYNRDSSDITIQYVYERRFAR